MRTLFFLALTPAIAAAAMAGTVTLTLEETPISMSGADPAALQFGLDAEYRTFDLIATWSQSGEVFTAGEATVEIEDIAGDTVFFFHPLWGITAPTSALVTALPAVEWSTYFTSPYLFPNGEMSASSIMSPVTLVKTDKLIRGDLNGEPVDYVWAFPPETPTPAPGSYVVARFTVKSTPPGGGAPAEFKLHVSGQFVTRLGGGTLSTFNLLAPLPSGSANDDPPADEPDSPADDPNEPQSPGNPNEPANDDGDDAEDPGDDTPSGGSLSDRDGDGLPDAVDGCPDDPHKFDPGTCGCGYDDRDDDGDGQPDCIPVTAGANDEHGDNPAGGSASGDNAGDSATPGAGSAPLPVAPACGVGAGLLPLVGLAGLIGCGAGSRRRRRRSRA